MISICSARSGSYDQAIRLGASCCRTGLWEEAGRARSRQESTDAAVLNGLYEVGSLLFAMTTAYVPRRQSLDPTSNDDCYLRSLRE